MESRLTLVLMLMLVAVVTAQRRTGGGARANSRTSSSSSSSTTDEWDYRAGSDKVNMKNVANLTEVLDNWKYDIISQMKNLLQNDHQSLLPDYARIQPLSEALDDLYKEFNSLKSLLGDLIEKFTAVETFIDELKNKDASAPASAPVAPVAPAGTPTRPNRRVIRKKAPGSTTQ
ncbi:hypothetical protein NL108_014623 [Boleophthalmus pectinirostris]|uniref:uncharacterized protein si:ch211-76l23.4 n=1 Tax=Boleophthalmus pectinirostris TaxID=150288 RepID=UPI002431C840|nr:uncharacterized protein si:ch211-76l23.4 [Boleophthalmus pectinirostris]KAJ0058435.1 hypothetical protein NL108_014623 [Boleophthalmus pectinirostris]